MSHLDIFLLSIVSILITSYLSKIFHEIGHLVVLKYVYKIKETGIGLGNVENEERKSVLIGSTKIYFYHLLPYRVTGSSAFVFPWKEVHEGRRGKRILFYSAGYMFEMFLSILLLTFLNNFINHLTITTFFIMATAVVISGVSPLTNVLLGFNVKKTYVGKSAQDLLKVEFGYSDGSGVLLNSKTIFILTLVVSLYYLYFMFITLNQLFLSRIWS